jgi:L-2-hydroxyglutarate oxidase LhgO
MDSTDIVVIGAGVVGLATARALAQLGRETLVIERHARPGQETSSRNSGVIHSGIYYPTGSLKARLCVRGREMLYRFCEERNIAHMRCGKIIVAREQQIPALSSLYNKALENGVEDIRMLNAGDVRELEPEVACAGALLSPSTGVVDVHELLLALLGDVEAHGATLILRAELQRARAVSGGIVVTVDSGGASSDMYCRWLVNCAGLNAVELLRRIESYPADRLRPSYYAKGNYFACHGARPFKRLVYPMPNQAGLGVHATLDMNGAVRFGPDVEWLEQPDYIVNATRAEAFYAAIREYWPGIPEGSLRPDYAGVRPKLVGPGCIAADFQIETDADHGVPGLINLLGIESPGLTSSIALGEMVASIVSNSRR